MKVIGVVLALALAAVVAGGQSAGGQSPAAPSLTVQYLEGSASQRDGGDWKALSIGDTVAVSAMVKLDRLALVQLQAPGASITLTQPGTYSMTNVVAQRAALRSAGAIEAAAVAFSQVLTSRGRMVNSVGGVRAEQAPSVGDFGTTGVSGSSADASPSDQGPTLEPAPPPDPAHAAIDQADDLIANGRYADAIGVLQGAIGQASGNEARQLSFYLASAYELNGDPRSALTALRASSPKGTDEWAPDSVLLGARLLEDTFAWTAARDLLVNARATLAIDEERAPGYYFLLALAYRGTGEKAREKAALEIVTAFDPESDLAAAAANLKAEDGGR